MDSINDKVLLKPDPAYIQLSKAYWTLEESGGRKELRDFNFYTAPHERKEKLAEALAARDVVDYAAAFRDIFENGGDINYRIPEESFVKFHKPEFLGFTALHFAVETKNLWALNALLELGADPTTQDLGEFTALRLAMKKSTARDKNCLDLRGTLVHPIADLILDAQVKSGNARNPRCKSGVSHLHIACMVNHARAVEFFVRNGVSCNEAISADSDVLPGYTALHFAARYCSVKTIGTLLKHGADRHPTDANGNTPLHLLVKYRIDTCHVLYRSNLEGFKFEFDMLAKASEMLTSNVKDLLLPIDDTGMTLFHVGCADFRRVFTPEFIEKIKDVNAVINSNSKNWPGYTPLHFAALVKADTFIQLMKRGADIFAKSANGETPFDICIREREIATIHKMFELHDALKNVRFSDGKKLVDVIRLLCDCTTFGKLLAPSTKMCSIPLDSAIWPGCTVLDVVIHLTNFQGGNEFFKTVDHLNPRSTMTGVDSRVFSYLLNNCTSSIHLAFRQKKMDIVEYMLNNNCVSHKDIADNENLSYLHILTCFGHIDHYTPQWLRSSSVKLNRQVNTGFAWCKRPDETSVYIAAGSTALHMAVVTGNRDMAELLIKHGADLSIKNSDGLTPIHLAFFNFKQYFIESWLSKPEVLQENVIAPGGLSNFHVACYAGNLTAVKAYLKLGADVNLPISAKYDQYKGKHGFPLEIGFTPLHFAIQERSMKVVELLVRHGADIHAKSESGISPLYQTLRNFIQNSDDVMMMFDYLFGVLARNYPEFEDENGWTLLHVACLNINVKIVKKLLRSGSNPNARIKKESPIFPTYAPLHLLMSIDHNEFQLKDILKITRLLIKHGADVNMRNDQEDTPIHICHSQYGGIDDRSMTLLETHKLTSVSPCNAEGFTPFHIACTAEKSKIVEEYLKSGVDVNQRTDYFREVEPGFTPLHFSVNSVNDCRGIIEILDKYGADVDARDATGSTPLHVALGHLSWRSIKNLEFIISRSKALINLPTLATGKRPLEELFTSYYDDSQKSTKILALLLSQGALLNVYNPLNREGVFATMLSMYMSGEKGDARLNHENDSKMDTVFNLATDLDVVNRDTGRNIIHNAVSIRSYTKSYDFKSTIERLMDRGCQLDLQDCEGETPLHAAVKFTNLPGVRVLLYLGSDISITNSNGLNPYDCCEDEYFMERLKTHRYKLGLLGLEGGLPANEDSVSKDTLLHWKNELRLMKYDYIFGESFSLRDFLTEAAVRAYPTMSRAKREAIDRFRGHRGDYLGTRRELEDLDYLFNLQYRKARERMAMMETAKRAVGLLAGAELPDPCTENIIRFTSNADLRNLTKLIEDDGQVANKRRKVAV